MADISNIHESIFDIDSFCNRLKKERKGLKLTQEKLAEKMDVSRQLVSSWEKGISSPSVHDLIKLSGIFRCDYGYLVGDYNCHKKPIADVKEYTGLSEEAINRLRSFVSKDPNGHTLVTELGRQYLDFYSRFIADIEILGMLHLCPGKILDIQENGLSKEQEAVFDTAEEAINCYKTQIQNVIMRFIDNYFKDETLIKIEFGGINNGSNTRTKE